MSKIELTNMVMIQDPETGKVLVQNRVLSWKGPAFPGGHVEEGESIVDSAVREVKEETGLDVAQLKSYGVVHWLNNKTHDRFLVFLFKTSAYSGELIAESNEGKNAWITLDKLREAPSENSFRQYLPMFLEDRYCEAFSSWNEDGPQEITYR